MEKPFYQIREAFWLLSQYRILICLIFPFISDCDEVYNYWEPLHYLHYGYGFQTWEYAPQYSLRSWFFASFFALLSFPLAFFGKLFVFYGLKVLLIMASSYSEAHLYHSICTVINPSVGKWFLIFLLVSPGMFLASSAFLPSSISMICVTMAFSNMFLHTSKKYLFKSILWFCIATFFSWPFSAVLAIGILLEEFHFKPNHLETLKKIFTSGLQALFSVLTPIFIIDSYFYRKLSFVTWNMVTYNVFKSGSELYGTEPWHYYLKNGFLNFNLVFILFLISIPTLLFTFLFHYPGIVHFTNVHFLGATAGRSYFSLFYKLIPAYIWLGIFIRQPHKEERFLFVIYPLICLNAAFCLYLIKSWIFKFTPIQNFLLRLWQVGSFLFALTFILLSLSRIMALYQNYSNSMFIYNHLKTEGNFTLCLGQEWYRFPSHYWLNNNINVAWVDGKFGSQLPNYFPKYKRHLVYPQEWFSMKGFSELRPSFNDQNIQNPDDFIEFNQCDGYLTLSNKDIKDHILESNQNVFQNYWKKEKCLSFLDAERNVWWQRAFYIPFTDSDKHWADYCLYIKLKQ